MLRNTNFKILVQCKIKISGYDWPHIVFKVQAITTCKNNNEANLVLVTSIKTSGHNYFYEVLK